MSTSDVYVHQLFGFSRIETRALPIAGGIAFQGRAIHDRRNAAGEWFRTVTDWETNFVVTIEPPPPVHPLRAAAARWLRAVAKRLDPEGCRG